MTIADYALMRAAMVESQLRTSDVNDVRVIEAMATVPRETFVPIQRWAMAYIDRPVPLEGGRALNPPLATGRLLTEAAIKAGDRVLLVGGATGYTAALLAAMGAQVTAVEQDEALVAQALGAGIVMTLGTLANGDPEAAPYDVVLIDGAVEEVPSAIVEQLVDGGRLVTGIVDREVVRLAAGRKSAAAFGLANLADIEMAMLPGFARPKSFVF